MTYKTEKQRETIEIDVKRYEVFCGCNDEQRAYLTRGGTANWEGSTKCSKCGLWKWYYPDKPLTEKPYAMVPLGDERKMARVNFGEVLEGYNENDIKVGIKTKYTEYTGRFCGFDHEIGYFVLDTYNYGTVKCRFCRRLKPIPPKIDMLTPVYINSSQRGLFTGFDDDGNPTIARIETVPRIQLPDGTWYTSLEKNS